MSQLAIAAMSARTMGLVSAVESEMRKNNEQLDLWTQHVLHGGVYCRTVLLPAGTQMVGVLVKIPTTVIVSGDAFVRLEEGWRHLLGYHVLPAAAVRKQHFYANEDTHISMFFPSQAGTVEKAEEEFTDEAHLLLSRRLGRDQETIITGE